ncbi:hypothetical protein QNO21_07585 [Microbacterium sp. zg-Y818]|uniref:hypothetical protein n=1 Tax=unclassified Microbacterium TaxID=2609290 RepID=UPI00214D0CE2|nr:MULTISPECIES: hypothetical protein [unclassified Microbacterium]MCR2801166.1 hypothetical protein [Microbacterium sp. zg.Y818]WIM21002.1 hypothetical protein QNO21_07585 [Microbacterium sp. zg-Y818]
MISAPADRAVRCAVPLAAHGTGHISEALRNGANALARMGEIAIVGRALPWNEYSLSHHERVHPAAFGKPRFAPPLLAEHTTRTRDGNPPHVMGTGLRVENSFEPHSLDLGGTGGGFDCLWALNHDLASVEWLYSEHLANGNAGLSVEMRVYLDDHVWEGWDRNVVRHVRAAECVAVAVVGRPSYFGAVIEGIVTPEVSWYRHRTGALVPDVEPPLMGAVFGIDYKAAKERALRRQESELAAILEQEAAGGEPAYAEAVAAEPAYAEAVAAMRASILLPPLELRSTADDAPPPAAPAVPDPVVAAMLGRAARDGSHTAQIPTPPPAAPAVPDPVVAAMLGRAARGGSHDPDTFAPPTGR